MKINICIYLLFKNVVIYVNVILIDLSINNVIVTNFEVSIDYCITVTEEGTVYLFQRGLIIISFYFVVSQILFIHV